MNVRDKTIRVCTWNVQGLQKKTDEVRWMVNTHSIDICLITETKLANDTYFEVGGYHLHRGCHPSGRRLGGSAVLVRKGIPHRALPNIVEYKRNSRNREVCFQISRIELSFVGNVKYQIGAFYAPPVSDIQSNDFRTAFQQLGPNFLLGGDFNCHHSSWNPLRDNDKKGERLHEAIVMEKLQLIAPKYFTYVPHNKDHRPSILDFFISKDVEFWSNTPEPFHDCTSDHKPILVKMRVPDLAVTNVCASTSAHTGYEKSTDEATPTDLPKSAYKSASLKPWLHDNAGAKQSGNRIRTSPLHTPHSLQTDATLDRTTPCQPSTSAGSESIRLPCANYNLPLLQIDAAPPEVLKVCFWNAQGLWGKEHELYQQLEEMDVIMIAQARPFPENLEILTHRLYRADHPSCSTGGSAILIRKTISHVELDPISYDLVQMATVVVSINQKQFQFASLYIHPEYDNQRLEHCLTVIFQDLANSPGFLVGGGFNARHKLWSCSESNDCGELILGLIRMLCLDVVIPPLPTFYPSTNTEQSEVVDFFIGQRIPELIQTPQQSNSSSEHTPIYVKLQF